MRRAREEERDQRMMRRSKGWAQARGGGEGAGRAMGWARGGRRAGGQEEDGSTELAVSVQGGDDEGGCR